MANEMDDYIGRHAAIEECNNDYAHGYMYAYCLKQLPSADVVKVVRCKDCKHRDLEDKKCDCGHDIIWQLPRRDDWYCADGERKDG